MLSRFCVRRARMIPLALFLLLALFSPKLAHAQAQDPSVMVTKVAVTFFTHNDNKDHDTSVSVRVRNQVGFHRFQDIARLDNFAGNEEFGDNPPSTHTYDLLLASDHIALDSLNATEFTVTEAPNGNDRWIFDVSIAISTSDGNSFSSTPVTVVLDQDNRTFTGIA